ncbi:MAG TPA: hypothetical protein VG268_08895, partial [Streptosporangiaceae bacterium]|nr:hypothetical protein [Streptosporangiaceae bacterium]
MIAGVLTAAVAIGVGQLISGLTVREGAPWAVVGEAAINLAPPPVKNFAIATFGSNDKNVLVAGILVVLAIFAAVIGVLAMRRLVYGFLGLAVFAAVGVAAAISLPKSNLGWAAPTVFGALGAAFALTKLTQRAIDAIGPAPLPHGYPPSLPQSRPPAEAPLDAKAPPDTAAPPHVAATGASQGFPAPAAPSDTNDANASSATDVPEDTDGPWAMGDSPGPPPETWTYRPPVGPARRRFLVAGSVALGATAVTAFAGRELNARQSVTEARSSIRIPKPTYPAPPLPAGSDLKIPNLSSFVTPNSSFYRVDTAIVLPQVDPNSWKLHIHGMVDREI